MAKDFSNVPGVSLGLQNNNPGNLVFDGTQWQGMTGENRGFVTFLNIAYGIRSLGLDLINVITNDKLDTIREIIYHFAPAAAGNDPETYSQNVSSSSGMGVDQPLQPDIGTIQKLVKSIILQENGSYSASLITDNDIAEGLALIPGSKFSNYPLLGGFSPIIIFFLIAFFIDQQG